jgi:hypothetical protein
MDSRMSLVMALMVGAAAGLKPMMAQAIQDAYSGFQALLLVSARRGALPYPYYGRSFHS